jgi:hypothetical protein
VNARRNPRPAAPETKHARFPVQVTIRATPGLPSLRSPRVFGALRRAIARASVDRFRVIHLSIQQDHGHFIVEGDEARGARGVGPAIVPPGTWMARVGWRRAGGPLRVDDEHPAVPLRPPNLNPRMLRRTGAPKGTSPVLRGARRCLEQRSAIHRM